MKKEIANYSWVFWLSIRWRPKWFKRFWKTRGANYSEYQFLWWAISVGRPWLKIYVDSNRDNYGSAKYIHDSNKQNLKLLVSFLIRPRATLVKQKLNQQKNTAMKKKYYRIDGGDTPVITDNLKAIMDILAAEGDHITQEEDERIKYQWTIDFVWLTDEEYQNLPEA